MVQAQPADLASHGKSLLLVEGIDDYHALYHILRQVTGQPPAFDIGYCGNDTSVLDQLGSVIVGSGTAKSILGAVLDADTDTGIDSRLQSIRHLLASAYEIPDAFPAEGLIIRPRDSRIDKDRLPLIGIWLMPDNVRDGIFEDLLCTAMAPESSAYIAGVIDQAKNDKMATFGAVERPKVIVKTHMAWQNARTKNLGEAISASHFANLVPACQPLVSWLARLFGPDIAPGLKPIG